MTASPLREEEREGGREGGRERGRKEEGRKGVKDECVHQIEDKTALRTKHSFWGDFSSLHDTAAHSDVQLLPLSPCAPRRQPSTGLLPVVVILSQLLLMGEREGGREVNYAWVTPESPSLFSPPGVADKRNHKPVLVLPPSPLSRFDKQISEVVCL